MKTYATLRKWDFRTAFQVACVELCVCLSGGCKTKAARSTVQDVSQIGHRHPWEARSKRKAVGIGGSKGYK